MYARATSGDKLNNNKFSLCSIRNISQVLEKKRNNCFVGMYVFPTCICKHSENLKHPCPYHLYFITIKNFAVFAL